MKIIVAVSGGVDSVVMLHQLVQAAEHELVVAHVDHGLRKDSAADARFVEALAGQYHLDYAGTRLDLASDSEASARAGRWRFLREVKNQQGADAIATGHHQDDVIETMLINLKRGTNRKGLTSLRERDDLLRPLLNLTKQQIYDYALQNKLEWVRDSTNDSDDYLRNRIRKNLVAKLTEQQRTKFIDIYRKLTKINSELNYALNYAVEQLSQLSSKSVIRIETDQINRLSIAIQLEIFATCWHKLTDSPPPDSLQLERMVAAVESPKTGNIYQLAGGVRLKVYRGFFELYQN